MEVRRLAMIVSHLSVKRKFHSDRCGATLASSSEDCVSRGLVPETRFSASKHNNDGPMASVDNTGLILEGCSAQDAKAKGKGKIAKAGSVENIGKSGVSIQEKVAMKINALAMERGECSHNKANVVGSCANLSAELRNKGTLHSQLTRSHGMVNETEDSCVFCEIIRGQAPAFKVFPKGSPLVSDMSRAVLSLSEDKEMQGIQSKWFNNNTACTNPGAKVVSNRLSMESFWGLYLITGTASIVALILCFSRLLYNFIRDPNAVEETQGDPSTGKSLKSFAKYVDRRERKRSRSNSPCSTPVFSPSPQNHGNESPFSSASSSISISISSQRFSFHEQQDAIQIEDDSRNVSARFSSVSICNQLPNSPQRGN